MRTQVICRPPSVRGVHRPLPDATQDHSEPARPGAATADDDDDEPCFLCGRPFRPTHGEPIRGGDDVRLCVGCGVLYELPDCCA